MSFFQSPGWCAMCVDVLGCSVKAVWPIVFEHALAGATGSVHVSVAREGAGARKGERVPLTSLSDHQSPSGEPRGSPFTVSRS